MNLRVSPCAVQKKRQSILSNGNWSVKQRSVSPYSPFVYVGHAGCPALLALLMKTISASAVVDEQSG